MTGDAQGAGAPLWLGEIGPGADGEGFLEKGLRHSLLFARRPASRLLVTFDNLSNVGDASPEREPWAYKFAMDNGLPHLGVMAHVSDWYRDAALMARFERLAREGFFEGYDRVVFAGVSMGAYGALAYSCFAPGAHVVAINPQSTLDPALVPWETRYEQGRRQDWTLPFGDGAETMRSAEQVSVFYDPRHELDRAHVERLSGENLRVFNCRYSQHKTAVFLRKIGALKPVMERSIFGELTHAEFNRLYLGRRHLPWFRGSVSNYFRESGREALAARYDAAFRARARAHAARTERARAEAAAEAITDKHGNPVEARITPARAPLAPPAPSRVIVTTMKNEGPFMLEWVAWNRMIGFTDILVYTNDCDDGTDEIAMRLERLGLATHVPNVVRKVGPQRSALAASMERGEVRGADWVTCIDCDEFFNVRVGRGHLDDLFAAVGDVDAVSVCWKLFGNSGRISYEDRPVVEQFDRGAPELEYPNFRAKGLKTLVRRSERLQALRVHRPRFHLDRGDIAWVDGGGNPMPSDFLVGRWSAHQGFAHDFVRLHHYAVRSVDSFLVKRDRGRTNHVGDDQGLEYWSGMNHNMARDTSLMARVPELRAEMARLMADPEIARLHRAAVAWHRGRIEALRARPGWAEFRDQIARTNAAPGAVPEMQEA